MADDKASPFYSKPLRGSRVRIKPTSKTTGFLAEAVVRIAAEKPTK